MACDEWICETCKHARFELDPQSDDIVGVWNFECTHPLMQSVASRVAKACDEYEYDPDLNEMIEDRREAVIIHGD